MQFRGDGVGTDCEKGSSRAVQIGSRVPEGAGELELSSTQRVLRKVSAGCMPGEEDIRSADGGTEIELGRPFRAEESVQLWRGSTTSTIDLEVPDYWSKEDSRDMQMSVRSRQQLALGIGQCNSLQDLMLGFTNGTLGIDNYQEDHQLPVAGSEVKNYFHKKEEYDYTNAQCEVGEADDYLNDISYQISS